jgi:hypothetical protein
LNSTLTNTLKAELWSRFGTLEHPAEWDGNNYGGGKLSQRFWEYFKAIELLDLDENSIVLDIGGGSPITGMGFFSSLLSAAVKKVIVMDTSIGDTAKAPGNVEFVRAAATYEELKALLSARPDLTHIVSVSVFEHVEPVVRQGMIRAINEFFQGRSFVATFEYHAKTTFFEYSLTAKTTSTLFEPFTNFYLDHYSASPVWCENAYDHSRLFRLIYKSFRKIFAYGDIPRWYPLAVKFLRAS